ncbi:MAG: sigma-70 family RNA polymerase sigma factor [Myxococcota bacterium]
MTLHAELSQNERFLWGLCYRMTGSAADADDLVQETFARALKKPPSLDAPLRPWLTKVALNLARDGLRRRKRAPYPGPWLPAPVETAAEVAVEPVSTEGRYDLLESVSFAFLLALEALTPKQRAVLLLRDVFEYSVRETADALGVSEDGVKTTHLRARRAVEAYDATRTLPTRAMRKRNQEALEKLLSALLADDVGQIERLLAASVRQLSDGGGEFLAARVPVVGPKKVARLLLRLAQMRGVPSRAEIREVNGFAALVAEYAAVHSPNQAPKFVLRVEVDEGGLIREIHTVLATAKLSHVGQRYP